MNREAICPLAHLPHFSITTMRLNILLVSLLFSVSAMAQEVTSPNGHMAVKFSLVGNGVPTYEMTYKGKVVVKPSRLGLELMKDKHASKGLRETNLMDGFVKMDAKTTSFDETWRPVWGETATIRNHYNELAVNLSQPSSKRMMVIRFRVYDDGMGLRYEFPMQDSLTYFIIKEEPVSYTHLTLPTNREV